MKLIKPLITFAILLTLLSIVLIIRRSNNRKNSQLEHFISQSVLDYFNNSTTRPNISNEKSKDITQEIIRNTIKCNENEVLNSINDLIETYSFPIAYNERHTVINNKDEIKFINKTSNYWIPSNDDYRIVESILLQAIEENKDEYWITLKKNTVKSFYRQYSFFTEESGDSLIFINAFCKVFNTPTDSSGTIIIKPIEWKKRLIIAEGGGDCFWNITINKSQNSYKDFWVNSN